MSAKSRMLNKDIFALFLIGGGVKSFTMVFDISSWKLLQISFIKLFCTQFLIGGKVYYDA